jgi:hypothetical protein
VFPLLKYSLIYIYIKVIFFFFPKASGLAGGKGVLIPAEKQEALFALKEIMVDKVFGSAGNYKQFILTFNWYRTYFYFLKKGMK